MMLSAEWHPFQLQQPWQRSTFSDEIEETTTSLDLKPLPPIEPASHTLVSIPDLILDTSNELEQRPSERLGDPPIISVDVTQSNERYHADDFWNQNFENAYSSSLSLVSWEKFNNTHQSIEPYISEAGQAVFDALAYRLQPAIGILPQDAALRSLCCLALGRSSVLYQWNEGKEAFDATLNGHSVSGYTVTSSADVEAKTLEQGKVLRLLRDYVSVTAQSRSTATVIAFKRSIARVLDVTEGWIATTVSSIQSLLQLDRMVSTASHILSLCWQMCQEARSEPSDGKLLATITLYLGSLHSNGDALAHVVAALLRDVTTPWKVQLLHDIGLATLDSISDSRSVSSKDRISLSENDENLLNALMKERDMLQEHDPYHPLFETSCCATVKQGLADLTTLADVVQRAKQLEIELTAAISEYSSNKPRKTIDHKSNASLALGPWSAFDLDLTPTTDPVEARTTLPAQDGALSDLEQRTIDILTNTTGSSTTWLDNLSEDTLQPAAFIRPLLDMQSRLTHQAVMSLLFKHHHLEQVFDLYHQTYLFGNAYFVGRLSRAFFESDGQHNFSMKHSRRKGLGLNTITGIVWPPSSSDLSLNLIGVLEGLEHIEGASPTAVTRLSFAVRELSEAQIERVCNTVSIHALDFIRLHSNIAGPLSSIFTSATSQWYEEIFSALLLHTRLIHLVTTMRARLLKHESNDRDRAKAQALYTNKAYHLVSTITYHAIHVAVARPWRRLRAVVEQAARDTQTGNDNSVSIGSGGLNDKHVQCLDRMRRYLHIGRRYEELRNAQHEIYSHILRNGCASSNTKEHDWRRVYQDLDQAGQRFVSVLDSTKHKLEGNAALDDEDESDVLGLLIGILR
ncbi:hypothetical protein AMS68_006664 [Peltaster fructicola]|uniref:Gamma tubulin complex component C-terminal domain-containing protein n=1 Tax=Peltaster fructicola TaxID=286661 RepID=A0A6H0Y2C3_9PEZI|nr:hypothetical protein AMS68_006664 [Peltaster fructicola]